MATEYTETVYVAEDGSFYREAEVRSLDPSGTGLMKAVLIPMLMPNVPINRVYERQEIKSPLPLTNDRIAEIIAHRRETAGQAAVEPEPAPSWDWEEPA